MRFYTKEWYELSMKLGNADMFAPVIDKEYSDEEFEDLYQEVKDLYIEEERAIHDEPPFDMDDFEVEEDPDEFDPDDYLIGDIDEDGEEHNIRHPESLEELREYEKKMMEIAWREYEERGPFDEKEASDEFDENYEDNLAEPDEDIPAWIRESVDPRLVALWRLPEGVYKKLAADEAEMQERYDELDAIADEALDEMIEGIPVDYETLMEEFDERDGDYVTAIREEDGDIEIDLAGWDEEGEPAQYTLCFEEAEVIENDGINIEVSVDEDGDVESTCDLSYHEVYFDENGIEAHMLMDDGAPKYYTLRCSDVSIKRRRA